ncbi:MAG: DNA recombination protein RmuC [Candidatus Ratteibacteria bacterium]
MNTIVLIFSLVLVFAIYLLHVRESSKTIREKDKKISDLEANIQALSEENSKLMIEIAELRKEKESYAEKISWTEKAQEQLKDAFNSIATQALRGNAEDFLKTARQSLESILHQVRGDWSTHRVELQKLVEPLSETLKKMDDEIRELEKKREGAYRGLQEQLQQLFTTQDQLRILTVQLNQALRTTEVRGQWGQIQLRRVVELAGMTRHVDYEEQISTQEGRPDMIIHLPNGGILPVDAKSPMVAYLDAINSEPSQKQEKLRLFARKVRETIQILASKKYWAQFNPAPEVVIMFVPNEASISAAYENDPGLLEYAAENHVLIATPVTLLGLLKAVAFGWQQYSVAENARSIAEIGSQLYERMSVFIEHLRNTGKALDTAIKNYNATIGSFETRLMPSMKKLQEIGASAKEIEPVGRIENSLHLPEIEKKDNLRET